jgi:virginiamycin B lyase
VRGRIEVFRDPLGAMSAPSGIHAAPNGDIWFTSIGNHRVGRVRPATGSVETFVDERIRMPANIVPGSDGRLWVTCLGSAAVASIDAAAPDPAASVQFHADDRLDRPVAIKSAPDGRLWCTLRGGDGGVGSFDPRAEDPLTTLEVVTSPTIAEPSALFVDTSGVVWWVNAGTTTIGRLDPAIGEVDVVFSREEIDAAPRAWAIDPKGWLWVSLRDEPGLLRFDPSSPAVTSTATVVRHPRLVNPDGLWCSADGAVWVADTGANVMVRHDPAADAWSFHGDATTVCGPFDVKAGGAGSTLMWFTNKDGDSIASVETAAT